MKEKLESFCEAAKKAGYAEAAVRISGCVVCTMPKGLPAKAAADLFNATPGLLARCGLDGSVRCLPSDAGRAVIAQGLRALPPTDKPEKAEAEPPAPEPPAPEVNPAAPEPVNPGKKPGKKK